MGGYICSSVIFLALTVRMWERFKHFGPRALVRSDQNIQLLAGSTAISSTAIGRTDLSCEIMPLAQSDMVTGHSQIWSLDTVRYGHWQAGHSQIIPLTQ